MFIQTAQTPNPATLKFLPGLTVMEEGTVEFRTADEGERSPLAARLFRVEGVEGVFFGGDFISVTKSDETDWHLVKPAILGVIMEHFVSGSELLVGSEPRADAVDEADIDGPDATIVSQIRELLDTRVRPAVAQDGGDIIYKGFKDGIVLLQLQGSCQGCPSSTMTLKNGVENMLKHYIPEVVEVRAI